MLKWLARSWSRLEAAFAIDEEERRILRNLAIQLWNLIIDQQQRVCDGHFGQEFLLRSCAFVRHSQDYESLRLFISIQLVELGHFVAARLAPCCPDIDEHDFSFVFGQTDRITAKVRGGEVGRGNIVELTISHLFCASETVPHWQQSKA